LWFVVLLQFVDATERSDWLRVLQRTAKVEQCDLFITIRKSNELNTSGEYTEVIEFEPQRIPNMIPPKDNSTTAVCKMMDFGFTRTMCCIFYV